MKISNPTVPVAPSALTQQSGSPNTSTTLSRVAGTGVHFPFRSFAGVLILTVSLCAGVVWSVLRVNHLGVATQQHYLRVGELRGVILLLDEVLTMSAHMSAATGAPQWEDRYHRFEPQLDAAIKETMRLESHASIVQAAAKTDAANLKLVEMEHRVFALVRQNQPGAARAILASEGYRQQKEAYSNGMSDFMDLLTNHLKATQASARWVVRITVLGTLAGLGFTLWFWAVVIRHLRLWHNTLIQAMEDRTQAEATCATGLTPRLSAEPVIAPRVAAVDDATLPASGAEESPVDWKRFHEIAEDSPEGARQLSALYLGQADNLMNGIRAAIKADASQDLCQLARKLGGSSSACGMRAILPPLLELEGQGRRGRLSDADQLFAQTSRKLESIRRVLSDQLAGQPASL